MQTTSLMASSYQNDTCQCGQLEKNKNLFEPKQKDDSVQFYSFLLDCITTLSIACAEEAVLAPVDTLNTRRPVLLLWKKVLADLRILQGVLHHAFAQGILPNTPST